MGCAVLFSIKKIKTCFVVKLSVCCGIAEDVVGDTIELKGAVSTMFKDASLFFVVVFQNLDRNY